MSSSGDDRRPRDPVRRGTRALRTPGKYPGVQLLIAATVIWSIVGSFAYILAVEGRNPPTILWLTVIALALAAAMVAFGAKNVTAAVDEAKDLAGEGGDSGAESDDGGQSE